MVGLNPTRNERTSMVILPFGFHRVHTRIGHIRFDSCSGTSDQSTPTTGNEHRIDFGLGLVLVSLLCYLQSHGSLPCDNKPIVERRNQYSTILFYPFSSNLFPRFSQSILQ